MAFKKLFIITLLAAVNADYLSTPTPIAYSTPASYHAPTVPYTAAPPAVTSQSANIIRSHGNLGQVSTFTKTIDTPYSSVSKSDVRVSNPGYTAYTASPKAPMGYHVTPSPVHEHVVASAPLYNSYPTIYRSSPAVGPALPNAYHQPAVLAPGHAPSYNSPLFTQHLSPAAVYQHPSPFYQHSVVAPAYQRPAAAVYQHSLPAPTYQHPAAPVYHAPATYPYNYPVTAPAGQSLLGVAYSHAPSVSHMSFDGHGINYTY